MDEDETFIIYWWSVDRNLLIGGMELSVRVAFR